MIPCCIVVEATLKSQRLCLSSNHINKVSILCAYVVIYKSVSVFFFFSLIGIELKCQSFNRTRLPHNVSIYPVTQKVI